MKTKEEMNALKGEVETLNRKLEELTEDELKQVTGGSGGQSGTVYSLTTDGNGMWLENGTPVNSITVGHGGIPVSGLEIQYTDVFGICRGVIAKPNAGYSFRSCMFYAGTNTYEARFSCVEP